MKKVLKFLIRGYIWIGLFLAGVAYYYKNEPAFVLIYLIALVSVVVREVQLQVAVSDFEKMNQTLRQDVESANRRIDDLIQDKIANEAFNVIVTERMRSQKEKLEAHHEVLTHAQPGRLKVAMHQQEKKGLKDAK